LGPRPGAPYRPHDGGVHVPGRGEQQVPGVPGTDVLPDLGQGPAGDLMTQSTVEHRTPEIGPRYTPHELAKLPGLPAPSQQRAGYEPATRLLTEAACWQLADGVVCAYEGDMSAVLVAPTTVTDAVLKLAADLAEHLRTPDDVAAWTGRFHAEVSALPGRQLKA